MGRDGCGPGGATADRGGEERDAHARLRSGVRVMDSSVAGRGAYLPMRRLATSTAVAASGP